MSQSADSAPKWTPYFPRSGPLPDATPLELVAQARQHLDAGDDRQWAGALWAAVRLTFLDRHYRGKLGSGNALGDHQRVGIYKDYWWEDIHSDTLAFIRECNDTAS